MAAKVSLESLLRNLLNTPETEKGAILYSLIKTLREACGLFKKSGFSEYQETGRNAQEILDGILSETAQVEDEDWEEEFAESNPELTESISASQPKVLVPPEIQQATNDPVKKLLAEWNNNVELWLKLSGINLDTPQSVLSCIDTLAALRGNIISNTFDAQSHVLARFDKLWNGLKEILHENHYEISPGDWNNPGDPKGRIIYTARNRVGFACENEMIYPGINHKDEVLREPLWTVSLPLDGEFPSFHSKASWPVHWRGVFGDVEIFAEHLKIQNKACCAIEGINKNKIETIEECRESILSELQRRVEVLENTIQKDGESIYRLATDYWRIEEFFWSIYHDDERPAGCSMFDRLRNRIQAWRTTMRRALKLHIRDFACGSDSLASINKYIGNIIIKSKSNMGQGMVTRELRPAIMVQVQGTNRLLKGRVIAT